MTEFLEVFESLTEMVNRNVVAFLQAVKYFTFRKIVITRPAVLFCLRIHKLLVVFRVQIAKLEFLNCLTIDIVLLATHVILSSLVDYFGVFGRFERCEKIGQVPEDVMLTYGSLVLLVEKLFSGKTSEAKDVGFEEGRILHEGEVLQGDPQAVLKVAREEDVGTEVKNELSRYAHLLIVLLSPTH